MQGGMVVFGVVQEDDNPAAGVTGSLAELLKEIEEGVGVEDDLFPLEGELAVA